MQVSFVDETNIPMPPMAKVSVSALERKNRKIEQEIDILRERRNTAMARCKRNYQLALTSKLYSPSRKKYDAEYQRHKATVDYLDVRISRLAATLQ